MKSEDPDSETEAQNPKRNISLMKSMQIIIARYADGMIIGVIRLKIETPTKTSCWFRAFRSS